MMCTFLHSFLFVSVNHNDILKNYYTGKSSTDEQKITDLLTGKSYALHDIQLVT